MSAVTLAAIKIGGIMLGLELANCYYCRLLRLLLVQSEGLRGLSILMSFYFLLRWEEQLARILSS